MKILLLEDDMDCRVVISEILSTQGYSVIAVRTPEEALKAIDDTIDIVLTDFDLGTGVMNGPEVIQNMINSGYIFGKVLMSGDLRQASKEQRAIFDSEFQKPGFEELLIAIEKATL